MSLAYDISAKVGNDKNDNPIYRKIGVVVKTKEGKYMMKLEAIPVIGWDGWAYLNPPQQKEQQRTERTERKPQKQSQGGGTFDELEDDIPF